MKMTESTLIGNFIQTNKANAFILALTDAIESIQATIAGTSDFLSEVKSKDEKTALLFEDIKGNVVTAAVIEYIEGEDGNPGSWSYYYTFDPKDVEGEDVKKFSIYSAGPKQVISNRGFEDFRMRFRAPEFVSQLAVTFFESLVDFLDQNAIEGEQFTLEHEGYFLSTVDIIDGKKVMNFIPDGAMKRLIKDDSLASADVK